MCVRRPLQLIVSFTCPHVYVKLISKTQWGYHMIKTVPNGGAQLISELLHIEKIR